MKPCLMMSPLSIATFLPPGQFSFDLVVMDEASQITPADAIGAIARANQCVIVGDPQQLPPTSFWKRFEDLSEEDDEEEATDTESILDQALGVFRPPRELRWHYRSRHESLIAFSNKHFYNNGLTVFPSWIEDDEHYGVRLVNVDGLYADRHNPTEAKAIAEWAVEFMRSRPNKSMGIVAVNQLQRDLIYDEMERRFGQEGVAEDYRSQWENTLTPFFVKNLENVQGDERDVIAISTVYGPNADGRVLQNFGPISRRNGYRRLNVLFTRARDQVVLFSSLRPENIDIRGTTGRGPRILKNYLDYALTGRLDHGQQTTRPPDSDFEVAVANRLQSHGYEVVAHVGVSGFYIDLAVRHPEFPGILLLGVECDGATYHSAKSARDRDRLREEVLFGLGWKLYRVWSTDWFRDPQGETEKLCAYIERLVDERRAITKEAVLGIKPSTELEMAADGEDQAFKEKPVEVEEWSVGVRDGEKVFAAPSESAMENSEDIFSRADEEIDEESDEDIDEELVEIGDSVDFRYLDSPDEPRTLRIVEEDYEPTKGTISPYSPIGSAFLDSAVGEEIELTGGKETRTIIIDAIGKAEPKVSVSAPPHTDYSSISEGHENRGLVKEEDEDAQAPTQPGVVPIQLPFSSASGMQITRYQFWQPRTLPDPRSSGRIDRATALKEIIEAEGPIKVKRAYRLYAQACGIRRVGREIRSRLNQALHSLVRAGEVEVGIEGPEAGQQNGVVYLKGTPKVLVRKGGNREFWEIPPFELAAVLSMKARSSSWSGNEDLYRQVLAHYGIKRLTRNMLTEFDRINGLLGKN